MTKCAGAATTRKALGCSIDVVARPVLDGIATTTIRVATGNSLANELTHSGPTHQTMSAS